MVPFPCRSCGKPVDQEVLDLGLQPLANNLPRPEDLGSTEPRFPLVTAVCPHCWLVQISETVPPVTLFSEYVYFSSFSDALLRHAADAARQYMDNYRLGKDQFVVEIASNDGYLLRNFVAAGIPCLGIEPAANIAAVAESKGIPTLSRFFDHAVARELLETRGAADLILGNNVFAHVPDTNGFVAGLAILLRQGGRVILEFPYACDLIQHVEFDTIYHEHVFYFTASALVPLFARHGLEIIDVEHLSIHGGSLRLFAGHQGSHTANARVAELLQQERKDGVTSVSYYLDFATRVRGIRDDLLKLLSQLKRDGRSIAAYGASAKGSTLLNYYGIGRETLDFVADRSTAKQGRLTPGTRLPIVPAEELRRRRPDYALLLTWNFAREILQQQKEYMNAGGRFIVPIPEVQVIPQE